METIKSRKEIFKERISEFLRNKLRQLKDIYGEDSYEYQSIAKQYIYNELEDKETAEANTKHYEASVGFDNLERLYKQHACVEINFSCAGTHCRYCLRQNYDGFVLSESQLDEVVKYVEQNTLTEILITGGDAFTSPKRLKYLIFNLIDKCPTLKIIRIATRTFCQNPDLVSDEILQILSAAKQKIRVEVATQISSYVELTWEESVNAFKKVIDLGIPVYSQNVFLKGINDGPGQLAELYFRMRMVGIEAHYLFASVPLRGTHHFRPSLKMMIQRYEELANSGIITGRCKPLLALMTGVGKITLTPFNVLEYKEGEYMKIRSKYKLEDRIKYNPNYKIPEEAWVDDEGYLCIKYLDGSDE